MACVTGRVVALLLSAVLAGCAAQPTIPETLGDNGLLVAEFAGGKRGTKPATVRARIDGKIHTASLQEQRYMLLPLPPGEYVLESLVYGDLSSSTTYTLNQKLRIERGKVTSLGMLVAVTRNVETRGARNIWGLDIYTVDDADTISAYLRSRHPRLYASLADPSVRLAPRKYLRMNELEPLRYQLAQRALVNMEVLHTYWHDTSHVVAGDLGTVGRLTRDGSGRIVKTIIYDTGSLETVNPYLCHADSTRLACVVGVQLFIHDGVSASYRPLPLKPPNRPGRLYLVKSAGMVVTDDKLNVYTSRNNGRTWSTYSGAAVPAGLSNPNAIHFAPGQDGYYLYSTYADRTVLYTAYADDAFRRVTIPDTLKEINVLRESTAGMLVIPAYTSKDKDHLYIGQWGGQNWEVRELPAGLCLNMWVKDPSGARLRIYCGLNEYDSEDRGKTWKTLSAAPLAFQ